MERRTSRIRSWQIVPVIFATALLVAATGCSKKVAVTAATVGTEVVGGKVTYNGKPVRYGFVLMYNAASVDPNTGLFSPVAVGPIDPDGNYEVHRVPEGVVEIAVATLPDVPFEVLVRPVLPGQVETGGPISAGAVDRAPGGPPIPMPPGAELLTAEQKQELRTIHAKYGGYGRGGLSYLVKSGQQTHDIVLK